MSIGNKLLDAVGEKSRDITDKISQKYKNYVGEEILKKQEQLQNTESELNEKKKSLDLREKEISLKEDQLNKFYNIPKKYIHVPIAIAGLFAVFFMYNEINTSKPAKTSGSEPAATSISEPATTSSSYDCESRGISYYREIGSYPRLSTGEDAAEKVRGMCFRSNGSAFGE